MNNTEKRELYYGMYEYVKSNFKTERELPFTAETLFITSLCDNRCVDYDNIKDLNPIEFVRALYLNLFLRFPENEILNAIPVSFSSLDEEVEFKNRFLEGVLFSKEAICCGAVVKGYSLDPKKVRSLRKRKILQKVYSALWKVWVRLPKGFKIALKKIVGRH